MKRLVIILLGILLPLAGTQAQYISGDSVALERRGVHLMRNGQRLSDQETAGLLGDVYGTSLSNSWNDAVKRFNTGRKLMISFGSVTVAGASLLTAGSIWYRNYYRHNENTDLMQPGPLAMSYAGVLAAVVGVAGLCAGTVVYITASHKMDNIVDACNYGGRQRISEASVSIGAQRNGIGVALIF